MRPVRRHRIGDQLPAVIHPGPDPAAINLCRDLAVETDAQAVVLFGSRAAGGWDQQSDLDLIIVHPAADAEDDRRKVLGRVLAELRERHYPGHIEYDSPHHGVADGLMIETPQHYHACRRTWNHVIARAAREGRIFTGHSGAEDSYRHDGEVCNEWELVTMERFRRASEEARDLDYVRRSWLDRSRRSAVLNAMRGAKRPRAALELGRGAAVHPGRDLPPGLGGEDGRCHRRTRRRLEPRLPERPGPHRPITPAVGARWWLPTPSTTCPPCGETWRSTGTPCGNASGSSAGTTCTLPMKVRALDREQHRPAPIIRFPYSFRRSPYDHRPQSITRIVPQQTPSAPALRAADQGVASSLESVLSDNTRRTYDTQWRIFDRLVRRGRAHLSPRRAPHRGPLPGRPRRLRRHPSPPCAWPRRPSRKRTNGRSWSRPAETQACAPL